MDPLTIGTAVSTGIGIINSIGSLFGGGGSSDGKPTDYNNRLNQAKMWANQYGVSDVVNWATVEQLITSPGVWQERTALYMQSLVKVKENQASGGVSGQAEKLAKSVGLPVGWIYAIVGGGLLLVVNKNLRKKIGL